MKYMNQAKRFGSSLKREAVTICGSTGALLLSSVAMAQSTDPATTAATNIQGLSDKFNTVYVAAFGVMMTIVVALVVWKYAKKLGLKV